MAIDRRSLIGGLALGLGVTACRGAWGQPAEGAVYVGIETSAETDLSRASFFSATGARVGTVALDYRAHGMTEHGSRVFVFPRRPGDRFAIIDRDTLEVKAVVTAPPNRRFYGHGAVTTDGTWLLTTENDLDTLGGVLGVYRLGGPFRREGEIALPGPGPHEITRDPERNLFHIALGGLQTHPDYGRTPLNLGEFRSEIVTLDFDTGRIARLGHWTGTEGISLRHLAQDGAGRLYIGGQVADPARARAQAVVWVAGPEGARAMEVGDRLGGYVSSVAAEGTGAVVTSSETGLALRLTAEGAAEAIPLDGASAVALGPGGPVLSGYRLLRIGGTEVPAADLHEFDNHGLILPG